MKKSFIKVGFMLGLALVTTVSLNSCSSEEDANGDGTEQNDADDNADDQNADDDTDKCEDGKDGEHKCQAGKCQDGEAGEGKAAGKGVNDMTVDPEPEPKPVKEAVRGGGKPKMTTDGSN